MTSVQRSMRQRDITTSFLQAPANQCYYIFVSGAGSVTGNYPGTLTSGYMMLAESIPTPSQGYILRDMGKTIRAALSVGANSNFLQPIANTGFFRAVQLITPVAAVAPTGSTTFGVGTNSLGAGNLISAGNVGDAGYGTYYVPIVIDGALATDGAGLTSELPDPYLLLGGQM